MAEFSHAEEVVQFVRESLLTKDKLYNLFYRANALHEISHQSIYCIVADMCILVTYEWLAEDLS